MFLEFVAVDWWFVFSSLLWILGMAIILITLGYYDYSTSRKRIKLSDLLNSGSFKKYLILGLSFIIIGLPISLIRSGREASPKYFFVDYNVYDTGKIRPLEIVDHIGFENDELEMNTRNPAGENFQYPIESGSITMPWEGYVGTPFLKLSKGTYAIEFEARGSKAADEFAKIFVFLVALKKSMVGMQKLIETQELSEEMKSYRLKFEVNNELIGKIRVQFFNNGGDEKGGDRNVWIRGVKVSRIDD